MASITFKKKPIQLYGESIKEGGCAPDFCLVNSRLEPVSLESLPKSLRVFLTYPSLDTGVCLNMNKKMEEISKKTQISFYSVSADLPFAQSRICGLEKFESIQTLSMMHNKQFGMDYGILITSGPLHGLLARSVFVLNENDHVLYFDLVKEVTEEPDYDGLFKFLVSRLPN